MGGLALLAWILGVSAPSLIRWKINKKPGVHVEKVMILSAKCLKLQGITFDRTWAKGTVATATVCEDKTIVAVGGEVTVDPDLRKASSGDSSGYKVEAQDFTVHLMKGEVKADLQGVNFKNGEGCAKNATVTAFEATLVAETLCGKTDSSSVSFASGTVTSSKEYHGHKLSGPVTLGKTTLDPKEWTAKTASIHYDRFSAVNVEASRGDMLLAKAESIQLQDERLYSGPLTLKNVTVLADPARPTRFVEVRVNGAHFYLDPQEKHAWGDNLCQTWLDAVPDELREGALKEKLTLSGNFKFDLRLNPKVALDWTLACKHTGKAPEFITKVQAKTFEYLAYDSKGVQFSRKTGPDTEDWRPLSDVNPNMVTALTTTEDPGFFQHNGFIRQAIENSLSDNIKAGKILRGGSTLSMQLAKNLWLKRSRTLGRKVQEAILTIVLESYVPKDKILELYLNIVEFGPDIYGIGPAAQHLLSTEASNLSLTESLYLVLRLPRPVKAGPFDASKKAFIKRLLGVMVTSGKVPEDIAAVEADVMEDSP